jgi:PAS domain S-box-containing protein
MKRFAQPPIVAVVCSALVAALVLPFLAAASAPPELLTALVLLVVGLAGVFGGVVPALVTAAVGFGSLAFVLDRPWRVALAFPVGIALAVATGLLGDRFRRRDRERELAETELAAIRQSATEAILDLDHDGTITRWSHGAEQMYGYSADDVEGGPLTALAPDQETGAVDELLERVREGDTVSTSLPLRRADGETFLAALTLAPLGNGSRESQAVVAIAADISEPTRLRQAAREADSKFETLIRQIPLVTYVYAAGDRSSPLYVSPQVEALLGYSADEWLGQGDLHAKLLHPDDSERVTTKSAESAAANAPFRSEYRLLARDGRVVWVRDEATTVRDEDGNPAYIQGHLLDISKQRLGEESLERVQEAERDALERAADREERLNFLARSTDALAASHEYEPALRQIAELAVRRFADWCIFDISDEAGELTRRVVAHAEPLPAPIAARQAPFEEPDEVARRVAARRTAEIVPAPGSAPSSPPFISGILTESYICLPLLNRERAVGVVTIISTTPGRRFTAGDLALVRDVARRAALAIDNARLYAQVEERAEAARVLTYVADGVFLLDRAGAIQLWNPAAETMTGLTAASVLHRPATEVISDWQEVVERIPIGSSAEPSPAETIPFETPNGERWFSIIGVNFFGGTVYAFRDVTDARRLEELKAEFVATASHELRTPLAAVYGAAQTLRRHDFALDEAGRARFISMITDESERLSRIVNEILLATQLDAGRLDIAAEPFDPAELVARVVDATNAHLPPNITLDTVVPEDAVPSVAADRDKARQVLVNLIDNAIKYSPDGGRVEVGIAGTEETVRFSVSDDGIGIPESEQVRIFDKFYRLDPTMTRGVGGTGLGLYICSELVERMGGRIWVESDHGQGSTFLFELPVTEAPQAAARAPEPSEDPVGSRAS